MLFKKSSPPWSTVPRGVVCLGMVDPFYLSILALVSQVDTPTLAVGFLFPEESIGYLG